MNNKEFISTLAGKMNNTNKDTAAAVASLIEVMTNELQDGKALAISGFGTFEVKKKQERIIVTPGSKQRLLVPPKLSLGFKPSAILKDKIKNETSNE